MYCHYIHVGWCIGKCPLYRGVLYSECPLSEVPLYTHQPIVSSNTFLPMKEDNLSIMEKNPSQCVRHIAVPLYIT